MIAAKMPMIKTTTSSSISEKPFEEAERFLKFVSIIIIKPFSAEPVTQQLIKVILPAAFWYLQVFRLTALKNIKGL